MKEEGGSPCARCGAVVPGGTAGCFALFGQVVALEYSDPAYGAANADEHAERVYRWARSVWVAWSAHHEWARRWTSERGGRERAG